MGNRPARRQSRQLPVCLFGWSEAVPCGLLALLRLNVSRPGQTSHWAGKSVLFCGAAASREARIVSAVLGLDVSTWPRVAFGSRGRGGQACQPSSTFSHTNPTPPISYFMHTQYLSSSLVSSLWTDVCPSAPNRDLSLWLLQRIAIQGYSFSSWYSFLFLCSLEEA